ncbi:hypothetical protein GCM10010433_12030 [Streptomyces pulveraceus]
MEIRGGHPGHVERAQSQPPDKQQMREKEGNSGRAEADDGLAVRTLTHATQDATNGRIGSAAPESGPRLDVRGCVCPPPVRMSAPPAPQCVCLLPAPPAPPEGVCAPSAPSACLPPPAHPKPCPGTGPQAPGPQAPEPEPEPEPELVPTAEAALGLVFISEVHTYPRGA